jgi:hypothetical protein
MEDWTQESALELGVPFGLGLFSQVRRRVGPEVGPTSTFYSCTSTGMRGPTGILGQPNTALARGQDTWMASIRQQSFSQRKPKVIGLATQV